jgi:hypothetical protein
LLKLGQGVEVVVDGAEGNGQQMIAMFVQLRNSSLEGCQFLGLWVQKDGSGSDASAKGKMRVVSVEQYHWFSLFEKRFSE